MSKKSWVQKRAECTPEGLFQRFYKMMRTNVQEMNDQPDTIRRYYTYSLDPEKKLSSSYFCVHKYKGKDRQDMEVQCQNDIEGRRIRIRMTECDAFVVNHRWNPGKATCDLTVAGQDVALWQVCKRALEPLFFQEK